jgi:hypothetical protein
MLSRIFLASLLLGAVAATACGGSSFSPEESGESGGTSGHGGTGGGATGGSSATGGSGGTGGSVGGSGGSGGSVGGSGGSGGSVVGSGGSVSGSGGSGGSVGGSGGMGAGGTGGAAGGGSGGAGGSTAGSSGAAGAGGTCGFCPRVACAPAVWITVQASAESPGAIKNLKADAGDLQIECTPNGTTPCQWTCQAYAPALTQGNHSITLSADGYEPRTLEFTVGERPMCGCCGCGCQNYVQGTVTLEPNGEDPGTCCANTDTDASNCGECGVVCSSGNCLNAMCPTPQL